MKKIAAAVFVLCRGAWALAQKDNSDLKSDKKKDRPWETLCPVSATRRNAERLPSVSIQQQDSRTC